MGGMWSTGRSKGSVHGRNGKEVLNFSNVMSGDARFHIAATEKNTRKNQLQIRRETLKNSLLSEKKRLHKEAFHAT